MIEGIAHNCRSVTRPELVEVSPFDEFSDRTPILLRYTNDRTPPSDHKTPPRIGVLSALKQFAAPEGRRTLGSVRLSDSRQVVAQLTASAGVTQAAQRLSLNLADALTGDAELLAHLFQGVGVAIHQPEP